MKTEDSGTSGQDPKAALKHSKFRDAKRSNRITKTMGFTYEAEAYEQKFTKYYSARFVWNLS